MSIHVAWNQFSGPREPQPQPLESKKAMDNLSLSLLSPELQAGVGEGHEGGLQLGKERAGPSLIKATLGISSLWRTQGRRAGLQGRM